MNVAALREEARAQGRVAIYDIPAKKWRIVYGPDAREMVKAGSGSLEGPEPDPVAPEPPDPLAEIKALEGEALAKLATELKVKNPGKLSRDELIAAIGAAQAKAVTAAPVTPPAGS